MSTRELIVLGTSSQVPTRTRNHSGYFLHWDGKGLLFDPGEGTQRQMLRFGVPARRVTQILITHFHGDHCLGLPGVLQRLALDGAEHVVHVHFPASGQVFFDRLRRASLSRARVAVRRGALVREGRPIRLEDVSVPRPGQSLAFVMDTRPCRGALELARAVDLLVCESTYLEEHVDMARTYRHTTAAEAARLAAEAAVRRLVLTHFSPPYESGIGRSSGVLAMSEKYRFSQLPTG